MKSAGKLVAAVGAVLLTATAVALPDLGKVKAPVAVSTHETAANNQATVADSRDSIRGL